MSTKETKTVRMQFLDDEGKSTTISSSSVNPALEEEGGSEIAQAVADKLIELQPFNKVLAVCKGVEIVERKVKKVL